MKARIDILGYPVDNLTSNEILHRINHVIKTNGKIQIAPINANKFYQVRKDKLLAEILRNAEIVIPEYAIVWGSKIIGTPLVEHIGGIMLMRKLLEAAKHFNFSFFFLGANKNIVDLMVTNIQKKYPYAKIAGWHHGYFTEEDRIIELINNSLANILLVAMGSPKQEYFIYRNKSKIQIPVLMGVGGSFDVFAGARQETPPYLRYGFEWIFRLVQDPQNLWKRYLTSNPYFVYQILKYKVKKIFNNGTLFRWNIINK